MAERRAWTIPPDDLPADAVIDSGRRQNRLILVTLFPVCCGGSIVWHQYWGDAAKEFIHMDVSSDPCPLLFIDEGFDKGILAISHNTDKNPGSGDLTSIRINDFCRISGPIYLDLQPRFSRDVHGGAALLLILLDVIAELGIHEGIVAILTAFLRVFRSEKLPVDDIPEQFLPDVIIIRHPFG